MHRRTFLTGLGSGAVSLTGCLGSRTDAATPAATKSGSPAPTSTPAPDIELSVEPRSAATADQPGRVQVSLVNHGGPTVLTIAGGLPLPITPGKPVAGDDAGHVPVLLPAESDHEREFTGSCWVSPLDSPGIADDAPWDWGHGAVRSIPFASEGRYSGTYEIVTSWTSYCFADGRYRFERHYERGGTFREREFDLELPLDFDE